eukprot:3774844-Heterocapsa_arctica.AAC.1
MVIAICCLRRLAHGSRLSKVSRGRGTRRLIIGGREEPKGSLIGQTPHDGQVPHSGGTYSMVIARTSGFENASV